MLLNDFYTIEKMFASGDDEQQRLTAEVHLNKSHDLLKGHFPHSPVVPGVAMVQIIQDIIELHLPFKIQLVHASNIKFLAVLNPNLQEDIKADIQYQWDNDTFEAEGTLFYEQTIYLKLQATYVRR